MTAQQFIGLGVRLVALRLALAAFQYLVSVPLALQRAELSDANWGALLTGGLYAVVAVGLWLFPMWIAQRLLPRTRHSDRLSLQAHEAARVGCALIGLWLFSQGLFAAVGYLFNALLLRSAAPYVNGLPDEARLHFFITLIEMVFALLLIFRAGRFASLVVGPPALPTAAPTAAPSADASADTDASAPTSAGGDPPSPAAQGRD